MEFLGSILIVLLIVIGLLYVGIYKPDMDERKAKELYQFYFKYSSTFVKIIFQEKLNLQQHKKKILKIISDLSVNESVKKEIELSQIKEQQLNQEFARRSLFQFQNVDEVLTLFGEQETLTLDDIRNRLRKIYVSSNTCDEKINGWILNSCIKSQDNNNYIIGIFIVLHPYKTNKYGEPLSISLKVYESLKDKNEWR